MLAFCTAVCYTGYTEYMDEINDAADLCKRQNRRQNACGSIGTDMIRPEAFDELFGSF